MDKLAPLLFRLADTILEDDSKFTDEDIQQLSSIFKSLGAYLDMDEPHDIH